MARHQPAAVSRRRRSPTGDTRRRCPYAAANCARHETAIWALAIYDATGKALASIGLCSSVSAAFPRRRSIENPCKDGAELQPSATPAISNGLKRLSLSHQRNQPAGALVVLDRCRLHPRQKHRLCGGAAFWRMLRLVILIVGVTFLMVRWFLMRPMTRLAERLRLLRIGRYPEPHGMHRRGEDLSLFTPLAREVETHHREPDGGACRRWAEARLREAGENLWTAERLTVHMREQHRRRAASSSSRIANPTCTCGRAGKPSAWFRPAAWSLPLSRFCAPATASGCASGSGNADGQRRRLRPPARSSRRSPLHPAPRLAVRRRRVALLRRLRQ